MKFFIKQLFLLCIAILIISGCREKAAPYPLLKEADKSFQDGDYGRAAWIYYQLKRQYRDNANIHISLGYTYLKLGWPFYAGGEFSTALALTDRTNALAWLGLGTAYADTNNLKLAVLCFFHARTYAPDNTAVYIKLGNAYYYSGEYNLAANNYLHAATLGERNADLYAAIGSCYENSEQWSKAVNAYEQALSLESKSSRLVHRLLVIYRDRFNNIAKTKSYYKLLTKLNPELADAESKSFQRKVSQSLITNPNLNAASEQTPSNDSKKAVVNTLSSEDIQKKKIAMEADRYEKLASVSLMNELPKEGLKYYIKVISVDPTRTHINMKIAELYEKEFNEPKLAIEFYSKYLESIPKKGDNFDFIVVKIKELQKKYNQIEVEERTRRKKEDDEKLKLLEEKKRLLFEQQKKELEKAREIPQNYDEIIMAGVKHLKQKEYDSARRMFQKAIHVNGSYPNAYHNLGLVYLSQTNYNSAVQYFKKAIECNSNYAESYLTLGLTYIRMNKPENAIEDFTYYLELSPNTSYAEWVKDWLTKNAGAR